MSKGGHWPPLDGNIPREMKKLDQLYATWRNLQPLDGRKQYLLSQRFTVDYNFNSNHMEGNTLTYGQTELLLLFGKVSGDGDLK